MFEIRKATSEDRSYRAALQTLQAEQAKLNRRVKAQREIANQITDKFYAIKSEWNAKFGSAVIDWN